MLRFLQAVSIPRSAVAAVAVLVGSGAAARADDFQTLYNFTGGADGATPNGHLLNVGGTLFGTAQSGGSSSFGAIFAIDTDGSRFHSIYSFGALPGYQPISGLVAVGSKVYGTTYYDVPNAHGYGTVFSLNADGSKFQNLHDFNDDYTASGLGNPDSLLAVVGSTLYGRTQLPYVNSVPSRQGAAYSLGADGSNFQTLYTFASGQNAAADIAALGATLYAAINDYTIIGSQIYGVDPQGGKGYGAIFSMNLDGSNEHTLYAFSGDGPDGATPLSGLTLAGTRLYGTSYFGGPVFEYGNIFSLNIDGSGFRIDHSFVDSDGAHPTGGLTLVGDTLYGTTSAGGIDNAGTIFSLTVPASQVPEPAAWVLALGGVVAFGALQRSLRRRFAAAGCARRIALCVAVGLHMLSSTEPMARAGGLQAGDIIAFETGTNTLYEIDPDTGVRTILANATVGSGVPLGQSITGMTVDAAGDIFLASNTDGSSNGSILRVDPTTGNRTIFAPLQRFGATLAMGNGGKLLAAEWNMLTFGGNILISRLDPSTGATLSSVTTPGAIPSILNCIVQAPSGTYYTATGFSNGFSSIDPATGVATWLSLASSGMSATSLAIDQTGSLFYSNGFAIDRYDPATGHDVVISGVVSNGVSIGSGPRFTDQNIGSMAFAPDGSLIVGGYNDSPSIFRVDPATGNRTIISQVFGGNAGSLYVAVVPSVPEPSALVLGLLAALGAMTVRLKKSGRLALGTLSVFTLLAISADVRAQIDDSRTGQPIPGTAGITPGPGIVLSNWNAPGHSLQYANFGNGGAGKFDLTGAVFDGSWLDGAVFYGALVPQASFVGSSLTGADFSFANASNANFTNANLTGAALDYATLSGANFGNATISGANFQGSNVTGQQLAQTVSFQNHDLTGVNLGVVNLSNVDLSGQDLTGGSLAFANLASANLAGANLTNVAIEGTNLTNTNLATTQLYQTSSYQNGNLQGIQLSGDNLTGWNLAGKSLTSADFTGATVTGVDFSNADLTNARFGSLSLATANFAGATIRGADFSNTSITPNQIEGTASYQHKDLTGVNLSGTNLTGIDLTGVKLPGATLHGAILSGANLSQHDPPTFGTVNLQNVDFSQATLTQANLSYSDFTGSNFNGADLTSATGIGAVFASASMAGTNLGQMNLEGTSFQGSNLTGANISNSDLTAATFTGATVTGASFAGATLTRANFSGVLGFTSQQLSSADKNLSLINLSGNNMPGWNFAGADLTGALLSNATVAGADFSQAHLA
ncbi:MAG TPA: pentapeptide repeat-containing protein, partial [Pirellulales bacterium]|nr:pentapeptide repeat-containing protein [Pirellulales bacterium]